MNGSPLTIIAIDPDSKEPTLVRVSIGPPTRRASKRPIHRRDAERLNLAVGMAWTDGLQAAFEEAVRMSAAREKSHRWIDAHPVSKATVVARLTKNGYEQSLIEQLVAELEEAGLIDDAAFAKAVIEHERGRKPIGERLLREKLALRGISASDTEAALNDAESDADDPLADATELAEVTLAKQSPRLDAKAKARRVFGVLARRGFEEHVAEEALRVAMGADFPDE